MNDIFGSASSTWVRYSGYDFKEAADGTLYVTPMPKAGPKIYDPLKNAEGMVVDALNVGLLQMNHAEDTEVAEAVMGFVSEYGLLGFMTALPTTPDFFDYDAAYFPANHFIREESMPSEEYAELFFPFERPDFKKTKDAAVWNVSDDREMVALAMTFSRRPMAVGMGFGRGYAERYDWILTQFKDLAFAFLSSHLYYEDYDKNDKDTRDLYRQGMAAFVGVAPTYHIALLDRPTMVWDFHSLLLGLQMMFSFMLTDGKKPLRVCRHCQNAFMATHPNAAFCSPSCKNRHNVYKSRAKK